MPDSVREIVQQVLLSVQHARSASEYAARFTWEMARCTGSSYCIWAAGEPIRAIALSPGAEPLLSFALDLARDRLNGALAAPAGVTAALLTLCGTPAGVLIADSAGKSALLEAAGAIATAQYAALLAMEACGVEAPASQRNLAELAHDVRQPLGIIDAYAFFLEEDLPDGSEGRRKIACIRQQVQLADEILTAAYQRKAAARDRKNSPIAGVA